MGVVLYKTPIEVTEPQEGLYILDFLRFWPVQDSLHLGFCHGESVHREDVPKILHGVHVELTLVCAGVRNQAEGGPEYVRVQSGVRVWRSEVRPGVGVRTWQSY